MTRVRVVSSCLLTLLLLLLVCSAESQSLPKSTPPPPDNTPSLVSARELRIPEKARKAFNKGTTLLAAKDPAKSIPEFQRAIKAFPDFYEAYYKLGIADLELQRPRDAEAAFGKSIELSDGRYALPHFGLGLILCTQNQFADAEASIRTGLDIDPADAAGHFTLAWVLYSAARLPEAEKSARQAILYSSDLAMAYLLLAQIHLRENNLSALVQDLDSYIKLDPDGPQSESAKAILVQAHHQLSRQSPGAVLAKANP
jgi:tetratricopeptide (TPR) repeat protein